MFIFASWLVLVTFLHHTDVQVPWYSDDKWDNVRGKPRSIVMPFCTRSHTKCG